MNLRTSMPLRVSLLFLLAACEFKPPGDPIDVPMTGTSSSTGHTPTTGAAGESSSSTTAIGTPSTTIDTTSTAASATSSSSTDETTSAPRPDAPKPEPLECNPLDEMPCPEGQKCSVAGDEETNYILFINEPACFPILGDKQKGEPCDLGEHPTDGLDDCGPDTLCFGPPNGFGEHGEPGICVEFCGNGYYDFEAPCADPNDFCYWASCQECGVTLCVPACDPLAPNCPNGQVCTFSWGSGEQGFMCRSPWPDWPGVGERCDWTYQCTPDSWCISSSMLVAQCVDGEACCTPLCDLDAPNTCPGAAMGEVCRPFFEAPFDPADDPWGVQYNDLGYCALP